MSQRILQILTTGYRATLEEQDDPVLWLTHSLANNGAETDVLLRGTAVNYAVEAQHPVGLVFGDRPQRNPPDLPRDLRALRERGVRVFAVSEDLAKRGVSRDETLAEVEWIAQAELPSLLRQYGRVWQW